jgi:hypothetical protein
MKYLKKINTKRGKVYFGPWFQSFSQQLLGPIAFGPVAGW